MKYQTGWTVYHASKWHEMYLDWVDNFLTVERFAEYYNMTQEHAEEIIRVGRIYNNNRSYAVRLGNIRETINQ